MKSTPRVVEVEGKFYRIADGVEELMAEIYQNPHMRFSFFSGGNKSRNTKLLKEIFLPNTNISLYEVAHKVLSFKDLKTVSTDTDLAFTQRYKKDLTLINNDLSSVVLIDDLKEFTPPGQKRNIFWLGKTYQYSPDFASASYGAYAPKSELAWLHERNKMFWTRDSLMEAYKNHRATGAGFVDELRSIVQKRLPHFPSMNMIRRADVSAFELEKKFKLNRKGTAMSALTCGSYFHP